MDRLPQELLDQITAAFLTKQTCKSLGISTSQDHSRYLRDEWHAFVHADLNDCLALSPKRNPEKAYPTLAALTPENARQLRVFRLVSHSCFSSVQRLLRRHQVLAISLDHPGSMHSALDLIRSVDGPPSKSLRIIPGESCTMPTRRFHTFDYSSHDDMDDLHILADYTDKALEPSELEDLWPCGYLCVQPRPTDTRDHRDHSSFEDKRQLLLETLWTLQRGGRQAVSDRAGYDPKLISAGSSNASLPLTSLAVAFPVATSYFDTYDEHSVSCWDLEAVESLLATLRTELFNVFAPVTSPGDDTRFYEGGVCDHLVELRLELPCTRHFSSLFPTTSQGSITDHLNTNETGLPLLFPGLRRLLIHITDSSGPSGNRSYVSDEYAYNDLDPAAIDGTMTAASISGYPPSNLQLQYPNKEHQDDMWRFIASCRTIESLCVQASHFLALDRLVHILKEEKIKKRQTANKNAREVGDGSHHAPVRDWTETGLKHIYLFRIYTDVDSLVYLLNPITSSQDKTHRDDKVLSPIRRLNLDNIKIYGHNPSEPTSAVSPPGWAKLFRFLSQADICPNFEFLGISYLTYFSDHPSYGSVGRPSEDLADMWTEDDEDWIALRDLAETGVGRVDDEVNAGRKLDGHTRNLWMQGADWEINTAGSFWRDLQDMGIGS